MMLRVDRHGPDDLASVACYRCGSVSGLVRDGDRFRCREACPPPDRPWSDT